MAPSLRSLLANFAPEPQPDSARSEFCDRVSLPNAPAFTWDDGHTYCWDFAANVSLWLERNEIPCDAYINGWCYCPPVKGNTDIAGTGVLIAFLFTASLTMISSLLCLALNGVDGYRTYDDIVLSEPESLNTVDRYFRRKVCQPLRDWIRSYNWDPFFWADCIKVFVQALSDIQLVTGLAILVAGLDGVSNGTISVYHLVIITDLAWFVVLTHVFSLLVLVKYHGSAKKRSPDRRLQRSWRTRLPQLIRGIFMVSTAILLLVASSLTAYRHLYSTFNFPAKCIVGQRWGGVPLVWTIVNYVFVIHIYPACLLRLSFRARVWSIDVLRSSRMFGRWTLTWHYNFLASETWAVLQLLTWFILGCIWLISDRSSGHQILWDEERAEEDSMGFGQLMPLILLLLPLLQFLESFSALTMEKQFEMLEKGELVTPRRSVRRIGNPLQFRMFMRRMRKRRKNV